jgi:hypothetical protein
MGQGAYRYVPVLEFADAFQKSQTGRSNAEYLQTPYDSTKSPGKEPLVYDTYVLNCDPPPLPFSHTNIHRAKC